MRANDDAEIEWTAREAMECGIRKIPIRVAASNEVFFLNKTKKLAKDERKPPPPCAKSEEEKVSMKMPMQWKRIIVQWY